MLEDIFGRAVHVVEDTEFAGVLKGGELVGGVFVGDIVACFILGSAVPFLLLDDFKFTTLARDAVVEGTGVEHDAFAEGLDDAEPFMTDGAFEDFLHVLDLHGVGAADETGSRSQNLFHRIDGLVDGSGGVGLGFVADGAGRAGLHFGQAVNKIVHDDVGQAEIFAGGMVQVISPDGKSVAVTTEDEDMTVRAGQADGGGKGQGATVNVVHAMGVHEIGETAGASDACNRDDLLVRNLELLQHAVENGQHGEVTATGTPRGVVGSEGFLGDFVGDRGRGGGGHGKEREGV